MKIFLSAVSAQFKTCRDALASDLRAIGCEVKVQEDFQQGLRTLIERLEEYVAQCDRVIALVGGAYGFEASGDAVPAVDPPRSYTQWEYCFAIGERLNGERAQAKERYVYFAAEPFLREHSVAQSEEYRRRQEAFAERIKASGKHWAAFENLDHLCRLVLRDGWQITERPRKPRNLPFLSLGSLFKGREDFLDDFRQRLQCVPARAVVVYALGGVGKTRLAIEYALRHEAEFIALLSVTADSSSALNRNLAALCAERVLNLPEREANEEDIQVAAALRWLDRNPGWLLVLDNVDTPEAAQAVEDLLPQLNGGQVLITSCLSYWSASVDAVELPFLTESAAVAFLLERTEGRRRAEADDDTAAHVLATELDGLALALEQAGAFIWQKRCSFDEYLQRWRAREQKVREWHDERLMKYPRSLAVTWDTTFEQLDPPAQALLNLLSWFAPDPVPRELLATEAAQQSLLAGSALLQGTDIEASTADTHDAVATLAGFSLLKWEAGNETFRIHRLVQEVSRERLAADERAAWLQVALGMVNPYFPADPPPQDVRSWPLWEPMRTHVAALIAAADGLGINDPIRWLMTALGVFLQTNCVWPEAESLYRRALAIDEQSFGPQHPNVAMRLNNLAQLLQDTNRQDEAEPLMRRALAIDEQSFGPRHANVARDLSNLARLLQDTNRRDEAEPLMRLALAICDQSFGPEHPNVAAVLNNLGALLKTTNRLAEAEPLMRRALAIDEHSFGLRHPDVARDLSNLASLLKATNRQDEAETLMRRALAIDEQSFGPGHPNVAIRLNNLSCLLQDTNRLAEAESLMRRALAIDEHSFGPRHPNVARDLNNLAQLLQATNLLTEAEPLMCRQLEIFLRFTVATGHEHPHLRAAVGNYEALLEQMGRSPEEVRAQLDAVGEPFDVRFGG